MPEAPLEVPTEELEQKEPVRQHFFHRPVVRGALVALIIVFAVSAFIFGYYYVRFAHMMERKLAAGPFSDTANIFAAPRTLAVGDTASALEIVAQLRRSGYTTSRGNGIGWYNLRAGAVEIFPGRDSYTGQEPCAIYFSGPQVSRIVSLQDNTERQQLRLEPQLITSISDKNRERRRLVHFRDIPPSLVHAVISAEDKRFFQHSGFDLLRIVKAAYVDAKEGRKEQGASTLTMQLARGFWLEPDKNWKRKLEELLITMQLEHKLSKQKIFEYYSNQVYLGRRGTFSINGFGEGAHAFFGKDIGQLTNPEAALLAGLVQRPSFYNPLRYPERAVDRRNIVLGLMRQNGYLTDAEYRQSLDTPLRLAPEAIEGLNAQYFLDLVNDDLQRHLGESQQPTRYVYTTLDLNLQREAEDAVRAGMQNVDQQLKKKRKHAPIPAGQPQVALIAMDPHTGEIKALVGGRNYSSSQLNHVLAMRQPGSVFKPFVYAAALDTAIEGGTTIFTPASVLDDSPTTFRFGNTTYDPGNFRGQFMGEVTLRTALAHSLNVATVKLAEAVGYDRVVAMARRAGLNDDIKPTPAVALGAYETTPLEIAGSYTVFANEGSYVQPALISLVRSPNGSVIYQHTPDRRTALDPRVAYLMVNLMQEVLRSGTGAGVRSRGVTVPAAGKTGTSHDGWFAGFTSNLLCVVWVGFDDNRELNLEGARSALPIWAEFMKRAIKTRGYADTTSFKAPRGIVSVRICDQSGQLAGDYCPNIHSEVFISGTEPAVECQLHGLPMANIADRVVVPEPSPASADAAAPK